MARFAVYLDMIRHFLIKGLVAYSAFETALVETGTISQLDDGLSISKDLFANAASAAAVFELSLRAILVHWLSIFHYTATAVGEGFVAFGTDKASDMPLLSKSVEDGFSRLEVFIAFGTYFFGHFAYL